MTLRQRLLSLITVLVVGFGLSIGLLHEAEQREQDALRASVRREQEETSRRLVELTGKPLQQFVDDYSWWDDMVAFVREPDPAWADVNLVEMIDFFDVDVMWVLGLDGRSRYQVAREDYADLPFPVPTAAFLDLVRHERHPWFFCATPTGILEVRAAPVQPSATVDRSDPPHGWFVVARLWHQERLDQLADALGARVTLVPTLEPLPPAPDPDTIRVERKLTDERSRQVARLLIEKPSAALGIRGDTDHSELLIFACFGVATLALLSLGLHRWVLRPLGAIEQSLQDQDSADLQRLRQDPGEFGRLARLVEAAGTHKRQMAEEVAHRREVAEALQQSEAILRQTVEDRVRLGRDLHDSVIQTLYASGMGIASARRQIEANPADADQRLQTVQDRLNETIRELRIFITGLEPESTNFITFPESVARLAAYTCEPHRLHPDLAIDDDAASRLSTAQRAQLLQVVREALSNIVRHAEATSVQVELFGRGDEVVLRVIDNGRGLPTAESNKRGRGLHNIRERVSSLPGTLDLTSTPGKGTRLEIILRLTPPQSNP